MYLVPSLKLSRHRYVSQVHKGVEDESHDERAEFNKGDLATMALVASDVYKTVGDTSDQGSHVDMSISPVR